MGKKRAPVWDGFELSADGKLATCKECRSQIASYGRAGTSHARRHKNNSCIGRQEWTEPPHGASPESSNCSEAASLEKATAVLALQDGAPPTLASPPTTPVVPPLGALPESSNCSKAANREEASTVLAWQDGAPLPIALPPTIPAAPPLGASPESSNCSKTAKWKKATVDLARMIALHGYDPSFVEDSYFRSFVRQLNPEFQVPSRAAIENICDDVCDKAKGDLESELEHTSGMVNFAIDTAETALGKVFYAACHFIDEDWNRRLFVLDANMVAPEDMRPFPPSDDIHDYVVQILHKKLSDLPISDRFFSKAIGNNSVSNVWLKVVARYETDYGHNDVLQMIADYLYHYMHLGFAQDLCWGSTLEYKATRQERGEFYSQLGLDHPLPSNKLWISLYFWLQFLHKRKERNDFSSPMPKSEELMCNVFGEISRASKTISGPNHPTSNIVLRELFKVRETLHSSLADASGCKADLYTGSIFEGDVVKVLEKAEKILDQTIKCKYLQWSIPLVLDPRYKLKYIEFLFRRAFSSEAEEYIAKITKEIKELFISFSKDGGETTDADPIHESDITSAHQLEQAWGEHLRRSEVTETELDRYLGRPLMKDTDGFNILNWWKLNNLEYPTLARMAKAALAMPTSSKLSSEQMSQITSMIRGYSKGILGELGLVHSVAGVFSQVRDRRVVLHALSLKLLVPPTKSTNP